MSNRRVPSPATVLSLIALVVALGGTVYAATKITGKDIRNGSITGKKVKRQTLGGREINEAKLGTVPSAERAQTAADAASAGTAQTAASAASAQSLEGFTFDTVESTLPADGPGPATEIFAFGGMTMLMDCTLEDGPLFTFGTTTDDAQIRTTAFPDQDDEVFTESDLDLDVGEVFAPTSLGIVGKVDAIYRRPTADGHQVVSASVAVDLGPGSFCNVYGEAVAEAQ